MVIGYARVSTEQQDTAGQLPDLKKAGCKRIYQETWAAVRWIGLSWKVSEPAGEGRHPCGVEIGSAGPLDRNLLQIVDRLDKGGINFISLKENFDTSTAAGRLVFHFFAALTQFERELIRERAMAGLSSARARGRMSGRKKLLSPQQVRVEKTMWDSREHTRHEIGAHFGVSVQTIDRAVRASAAETKSGAGK